MGIEVLELELTIIRGDGLAAKDSNIFRRKTLSDPYVEVRLCPWGPLQGDDKKILVGKTVPKMKTLQPRWDATFITSFPIEEFSEFAAFELTIMDYDKYGTDDPMGVIQIKIPPSNIGSDLKTKWHRIPASSIDGDEATGRIECTMRTKKKILRDGEEPTAYQDPIIPLILQGKTKKTYKKYLGRAKRKLQGKKYTEQIQVSAGPKEDMVELDIKITRARDLAPMDTNLLGMMGKSDPYIVVRLCPQGPSQGGNKLYMGKTPTVFKTLDPIWKEQNSFSITLPMSDFNRFSQFELTIWDYDKSNEDDIMGVVPVPFRLERPGTTTKWYKVPPLSAGSVGATGDVECILSVKTGGNNLYATGTVGQYMESSMDVEESLQKRMSTAAQNRRSTISISLGMQKRVEVVDLVLKVKRAKGLTAMDSNVIGMSTTSDPYVIVNLRRMGPSTPDYMKIEMGKSRPHFKTLDPKFNKLFKTTMLKSELSEFAMFEITIWDFDETDEDDLMGKVCVHIPSAKSGTTTKWYAVPPNSAGPGIKAKGEVECTLTVTKRLELEEPDQPADGPGAHVQRPVYKRTNPNGLEVNFHDSEIDLMGSSITSHQDNNNTTIPASEEFTSAETIIKTAQGSVGDKQDTTPNHRVRFSDTNGTEKEESETSPDEITLQQLVKKSEAEDPMKEPVKVAAVVNNTFWSGWGGDYVAGRNSTVDTKSRVESADSLKGQDQKPEDHSTQQALSNNTEKMKSEDTDRSDGNKQASSETGVQSSRHKVGRINRKTMRRSNSMDESSRQDGDKQPGSRRSKSAKPSKPGKPTRKEGEESQKPDSEKPGSRRTKSVGAKPKRKDENKQQQKDEKRDGRRAKSVGATRKRNKESMGDGSVDQTSSAGKKSLKEGSLSRNDDEGKSSTKKTTSKHQSKGQQGSSSSVDVKTDEEKDLPSKKSKSKRKKKNPDRDPRSQHGSSSSLDINSDNEKDPSTKKTIKTKKKILHNGSSSSFSALDIDIDDDDAEVSTSKVKKNRKNGSSSSFSAVDIDIDMDDDTAISKSKSKKNHNHGSSSSFSASDIDIDDDEDVDAEGTPKKRKSKSKKKAGIANDKSSGPTKSHPGWLDKKSSKEDGEDVYQQRLKVCNIYHKYTTLKRSQSQGNREKARMTLFADQ